MITDTTLLQLIDRLYETTVASTFSVTFMDGKPSDWKNLMNYTAKKESDCGNAC
jgi:hypothetical protein